MRYLVCIIVILFFASKAHGQSTYVLPYPSNMPGSIFYNLDLIHEKISKYWYFGNFGQFDYNLKMADKYLVEAKTLFEYKQYLLGHKALRKSDEHFTKISAYLEQANRKNKNISNKKTVLKEAALKHIEVLEKMDTETPDVFHWEPEKVAPTSLYLKRDIESAINIRKNNL